jgi:signal peptidase I
MRSPADPGPADSDPAGTGPTGTGPADHGPADHGLADPGPADRVPADRVPADRVPGGSDPTGTGPADHGPAGTDPADAEPTGKGPRRRRWRRGLIETAITLLAAVLLSFVVRTYAIETFFIPSGSMIPTLSVYDRILVQKAFFDWHDVHEGDIVVFNHPPLDDCPGPAAGDLVKRVIALPGQTIYSSGNSIYIDGHLLSEPYLPTPDPLGRAIASKQHPYRVPAGDLYVLGDNRSDSCDSRYWGPIQGSSIVGKAILVIWHNSHPELHGL